MVSGAIVMFSLFAVLYAFPVIVENTFQVSQGSTEIANIENQILRTKIEIYSISASAGNDGMIVIMNNTGIRKLWDYEKFDFIVTYDRKQGSQTVRTTEKLSFVETCPAKKGEWCMESISSDNVDVGIINSGEDAKLNGNTQFNIHPLGGTVIVTIATDNGETTTRSVVV